MVTKDCSASENITSKFGFGTASAFGFSGGVAGVIGVALEAAAEDGSGGVILFGLGLRTGLAGGAGIPPLLSSFLTFSIVFFTVVSVVVVDGWSVFTVVSVLAKCCKCAGGGFGGLLA